MKQKRKDSSWRLALGLGFALLPVLVGARTSASDDIASLSLEELANLEISSVSRKSESLAEAAASIFVITAEDIHRIGAISLPEALRLAPNLQVARYGAGSWAISARGFNSLSANKLLVLIDGRPIYSTLHSGVFWDTHDVFMPDIERIEVISGPNATTWGSNAVNGVINVVTRSAADTTGGHAALHAGDTEQIAGVRFGAETNGGAHYRVYGRHFDIDATEDRGGASRGDDIDRAQAGFRVDFGNDNDSFTVQGDAYDGELGTPGSMLEFSGANLRAHWQRINSRGSVISLATYIDTASRGDVGTGLEENVDIFGASASHQFDAGERHALVWGTDIRYAHDDITNTPGAAFLPARRDISWISLFIQDEMRLGNDFALVLGARAEDNEYTGLEFMPNVRVAWTLAEHGTLWTSLSRAVRTPSRIDRDLYSPATPPFAIAGGPDFESEIANVFELGYRAQPTANFSWSVTAFHHDYDRLRTFEVDGGGVITFGNRLGGTTSGLEGWWSWQPLANWQLSGGAFVFDKDLELEPGSTSIITTEGNDPDYQLHLRSSWTLSESTVLELFVRHVDELPEPETDAYTDVDARLGWRPVTNLELALRIRNLLDDEHAEFGTADAAVYGRSVFVQLHWDWQ